MKNPRYRSSFPEGSGRKERGIRILKRLVCLAPFVVWSLTAFSTDAAKPAKIVVASGRGFEPVLFLNERGDTAGMYADLWNLWSEKTGVKVEFRLMDWADVFPSLLSGQVDAVEGVTPTPERGKSLDFTRPHGTLPIHIFYHESLGAIRELADLAGFPVGVMRGSYLQEHLGVAAPTIQQVTYGNCEEMVQAAVHGEIRVLIGEVPTIPYFFAKAGSPSAFKRSRERILTSDICTAVRKGDKTLLSLLDDGFASISTAEWAKIHTDWEGSDSSLGIPWVWGAWSATGLVVGICLLVLWNVMLRKRVNQAVRTIRERQETINAIVETSHDWIWAVDAEGLHTYSNPAVQEILGYDLQEIVGKDCHRYLHPEDFEKVRSHWAEWKQKKLGWKNLLLRWRHKDGSYRQLESSGVPILSSKGELIGFRGVDRDITDRRKTEEALRASERTLRQIVDIVPHSIFAKDREGRFLLVNQRCAELMGTTLEGAIGKTQAELTPDENESRVLLEEDEEVLRTGQPIFAREHTFTDLNGLVHVEEATKVPFTFPGQEGQVVLGICLDVTGRKMAEEALRQSEIHFRTLIENSSDVFTFVELDGTILYSNPSVERILGYPFKENTGRSIFELVHPDDLEAAAQVFQATILDVGVPKRVECRLRHLDGTWREVEVFGKSVIDPNGKTMGVINYHDISERKRLEEQLRQSQKMEAIGQLAGGVAHDFNNLLVAILGHTQLAEEQLPEGTPGKEDLGQVRLAAERAASLTRQLLAFSRRQILETVDLDLNEVVGGLTKMLVRLIGEHINLQMIPGGNVRPIHADRDQIGQVLMNLCVNARDAMPEGGTLTIETDSVALSASECRTLEWAEPGRYSRVKVSDTGEGMDKETLTKIFEPFFTTKEVGQGTGLGLPTVYGIVKQHEGLIQVESSPGKGTTFSIYFPIVGERSIPTGAKEVQKPAGGSETILLAEDDASVRDLGVRVLEEAGYRVLVATDGQECLEILETCKEKIDLALLDVVRKNFTFTGKTQLIQKPYKPSDLLLKIRETLDHTRRD